MPDARKKIECASTCDSNQPVLAAYAKDSGGGRELPMIIITYNAISYSRTRERTPQRKNSFIGQTSIGRLYLSLWTQAWPMFVFSNPSNNWTVEGVCGVAGAQHSIKYFDDQLCQIGSICWFTQHSIYIYRDVTDTFDRFDPTTTATMIVALRSIFAPTIHAKQIMKS